MNYLEIKELRDELAKLELRNMGRFNAAVIGQRIEFSVKEVDGYDYVSGSYYPCSGVLIVQKGCWTELLTMQNVKVSVQNAIDEFLECGCYTDLDNEIMDEIEEIREDYEVAGDQLITYAIQVLVNHYGKERAMQMVGQALNDY